MAFTRQSISILLPAFTEKFQQPLKAPAVNSSVITKNYSILRVLMARSADKKNSLTVYEIVNGCEHRRLHLKHQNAQKIILFLKKNFMQY